MVFRDANISEVKLRENKNIQTAIIFDEMGLSEISENNPLKVLHSELEPEDPKISFIGMSNWRLDMSKMNRAAFIAQPDIDELSLKDTMERLFVKYPRKNVFDKVKELLVNLVKTY